MSRVKGILFDFDGVIIESNSVREYGFRKSLEAYPNDLVEDLVNYHNANGGLSRYHKYEYFFTQILRQKAKEGQVMELANAFFRNYAQRAREKEIFNSRNSRIY